MKKKGFTLVELLAVIVILAIILVIAVPKIMDTIENAKLGAIESTARLIINGAEKKYIENQTLGITDKIVCDNIVKVDKSTYGTCKIEFDDLGKVTITLNGNSNGKFANLACKGTERNLICKNGQFVSNAYLAPDFMSKITAKQNTISKTSIISMIFYNDARTISGADYVIDISNNQDESVMAYLKLNGSLYDMSIVGEDSVVFPENSSDLFSGFSKIENIDFNSAIDTSKVTNMSGMFSGIGCYASENFVLDLSDFNTSNVTDMSGMFSTPQPGYIRVTNIIFGENFDTSNVTNMSMMFYCIRNITSLDISMFDTSNVTNMNMMFAGSSYYKNNLVTITVGSGWNTSNVTNSQDMFSLNTSLVGNDGTKVTDISVYDKTVAHTGAGGLLTIAR